MSFESSRAPGIVLVAAILVATGSFSACEKKQPPPPAGIRPVKILTVGEIETSRRREYPGTIRGIQNAEMGFEVQGRITEFLVKEGEKVSEGQVLARLDDRDYQADLEQAEANLRKAEADLQRSLNIFEEDPGAITQDKIESDRRAVEVSRAAVDKKKKGVEDTVLRAPFTGLMARKLVEDFANVAAKEPVLIIQDLSTLEIEISVPERDVTAGAAERDPKELTERVKPRVVVSSLPGRELPAWVKEFTTTADPVTRTFQAKLNFEPSEGVSILPGMTARVVVEGSFTEGVLVPAQAVAVDPNEEPFVWVFDPQAMTVSRQNVELGELGGDDVEVLKGLNKGQQIAVSGVRELQDGMKVRRWEPPRGS
jgi:RND family efflux transporter MFP subunit